MAISNFVDRSAVCAILLFLLLKSKNVISSIATSHYSMNINMPDVRPHMDDAYICTAKKLNPVESYIVQYEPDADGRMAHHMLLYGCQGLKSQSHLYPGHWSCGSELCSQMTIMYGWAKNAPAMKLPPNVGFLVGGNSSIQYLVLQVHYVNALPADASSDNTGLKLHMTVERQPFITGIHLLMADAGQIPPFQPKYSIDLNCKYKSNVPIHVFAYRVHTHKLGTVVSGYKYNLINDSWTTLAKGNPQWPQAFYPITHQVRVTSTDILAARCTYNSTLINMPVTIGSAATNEMCNLYLMYYTEYRNRMLEAVPSCVGMEYPDLVQLLPTGNDVSLPSNEILEHRARNFNNHGSAITYGDVENADLHTSSAVNRIRTNNNNNNLFSIHTPASQYSESASYVNSEFKYQGVHGWPSNKLKLGQVSAVAIDRKRNPVIFHRGSHVWDALSFDYYNNYKQSQSHPIPVPTVITLDPVSGVVLEEWGKDMFFMPHGLTIDNEGKYWITDVALHQVFCFSSDKKHINLITLGEKFVPGSDESHFCKPTSVAVSSSGEFYVADGYCNSRIIQFSSSGKFQIQFGKPNSIFDRHPPVGTFNIPHKVILLEDRDLICVADRENGRVQCFAISTGNFRFKIEQEEFGGTVYSISYAKDKGLLFAINGAAIYQDRLKAFVFNMTSQQLLTVFSPKSGTFTSSHDISVSDDGEEVYVCEIGPNVVRKFLREYHKTTKKVLETPEVNVIQHSSVNSPSPPHTGHVQILDSVSGAKVDEDAIGIEDDMNNFETSMIIMALLGIPVLLLILITVGMRLRKRGSLQACSFGHLKGWLGGYKTPHPQKKFDLGNFLNPHKGFDKVAMEESDGEDDGSGSDIEEFNATTNKA